MIQKILLVSDRSKSAEKAAQTAAQLARSLGAEVLAIYVMIPAPAMLKMAEAAQEPYYGAGSLAGVQGLQRAGEAVLAQTVEILEQAGVSYTARVERGHPAVRICEVAQEEGADLIIIGRQGVYKASAFSPESLSDRVSQCAACPVMVV